MLTLSYSQALGLSLVFAHLLFIRNSTSQGSLRNPARAKGTKWKEGCTGGTCSGQESWVPGIQHGQRWQEVADCIAVLLMMCTHLKVTRGLGEKSLPHYMKLRSNRAVTVWGLTQSPRDYGPISLPSESQICKTEELGPGSRTWPPPMPHRWGLPDPRANFRPTAGFDSCPCGRGDFSVGPHPPTFLTVLAVRVISVSLWVTFPIHTTMGDVYGVEFSQKLGKFWGPTPCNKCHQYSWALPQT